MTMSRPFSPILVLHFGAPSTVASAILRDGPHCRRTPTISFLPWFLDLVTCFLLPSPGFYIAPLSRLSISLYILSAFILFFPVHSECGYRSPFPSAGSGTTLDVVWWYGVVASAREVFSCSDGSPFLLLWDSLISLGWICLHYT